MYIFQSNTAAVSITIYDRELKPMGQNGNNLTSIYTKSFSGQNPQKILKTGLDQP